MKVSVVRLTLGKPHSEIPHVCRLLIETLNVGASTFNTYLADQSASDHYR